MHATTLRRLRRSPRIAVAAALCGVSLSGCAQWGSAVLEDNHVAFNTSVAEAMDRQMLLNIVRISQRRPTQWMNVSLINVQTTVGAGATGGIAVPSDGMVSGVSGGSVNFSYTPNITFTPQQGERLARELMSPIPVSTVERLVSAGWPFELVTLLCVEKIGKVEGFDVTSDDGLVLANDKFGKLLQAVEQLGRRHLLSLSQVPQAVTWNTDPIPPADVTVDRIISTSKGGGAFIRRPDGNYDYRSIERVSVMTLYEGIESAPNVTEIMDLLGLPAEPGSYRLVASEDIWPGRTLSIRARSFVATLQLLAMGVDPGPGTPDPDADIDTETELFARMAATSTHDDLSIYVRALFRVRCGNSRPASSLVCVSDGNLWYWIDAADKTSRGIFAMVRDMYDLQVTAEGQAGPILTLPVGTGR